MVCATIVLAADGCGGKSGDNEGEVSARAPDYRRWFPEMAALGVKVIRVYTLLDPSF